MDKLKFNVNPAKIDDLDDKIKCSFALNSAVLNES